MECILIGAPLQIGAGHLGCEMGPSAFRIAGLAGALEELGHRVRDLGNLGSKSVPAIAHANASVHHLGETVAWIKLLSAAAYEHSNNSVPIFLGGDHTISAGTIQELHGAPRRTVANSLFSGLTPTPISIRWKPPSAETCMARPWPTILAGVDSRASFQR